MQEQQQPTTEPGYSEKQQMLNSQPALQQYQQNQQYQQYQQQQIQYSQGMPIPMPNQQFGQQIQYSQGMPMPMPNQQFGQNQYFAKLQNEQSVTFRQKPNCGSCYCPCFPKYSFNQTYIDREVGQELFKSYPTKNCCGCCYQTEIKSLSDVTLLKSQRAKKNSCSCCCSEIPMFVTEGSGIHGKETEPACASYCCLNGEYVYGQGKKKYYIGQSKEALCYGGESISVLDIWNPERTQRLGAIYFISRIQCCGPLAVFSVIPCCKLFCICEQRWLKISFPKNISVEDKALLMSAVSSGQGESQLCCIPYD